MSFAYIVVQIAVLIPVLVVLIVGLALLAARRPVLGSRAVGLATAGCVVLLGGAIAGAAWVISLPVLVSEGDFDVGDVAGIGALIGLLSTAAQATGIGLLVAAVLAGRRPEAVPYASPSSAISATADP